MKCGDPSNPGGQKFNKRGLPCGLTVMPGTFACYQHGGASPAAKAESDIALSLLRHPAIEALFKVLNFQESIIDGFEGDTCAACGRPTGDLEEQDSAIRAAHSLARTCQTILDRTGMGPSATLTVNQSDGTINLAAWTTEERGVLRMLLASLKDLKQQVKQRQDGGEPAKAPVLM